MMCFSHDSWRDDLSRTVASQNVRATSKSRRNRAAGVVYTPGFVVDYIVRQALAHALAKSPLESPNRPRVLDPACGAGAFLIGVYRHLLEWHLRRYVDDDPQKHAHGPCPRLSRSRDGAWRLALDERRKLLLESVFGADIDPGAVDAAKSALVLTMFEEFAAGSELSETQAGKIAERTIEHLSANIRCGNVLIDPADIGERSPLGSPLQWPGRFDAVVGNPPYRRELGFRQSMESLAATRLGKLHRSARMDLWYYFLHRGMELLESDGVLSFVVSSYWTSGGRCREAHRIPARRGAPGRVAAA